jgi:hypothetical protein
VLSGHCLRRRAWGVIAVVALSALAACGGQTRRAIDLTSISSAAFGPNAAASSGQIAARTEIAVQGVAAFAQPVQLSIDGPFSYGEGDALPSYDLQLSLRDYGSELSSVAGKSYLSLGDTGFELPASVRRRLETASARGANGLTRTLEQFGIAPWRWEIDKHAVGTELIDGVEVVRVATGVDVKRFLADANTLAGLLTSLGITRAVGLPPRLPARARKILVDSVRSASGTSWIGLSDKVLRRAMLKIVFAVPAAARRDLGGISGVTVTADVDISQVGRPQPVAAPQKLGSYHNLKLLFRALGDQQAARRVR